MEAMEVKNESGELILPASQLNGAADPIPGANYVDDAEYDSLKQGTKVVSGSDSAADTTTENITADKGSELIAAETPANSIDYDAILKEKTGGKYEKWDDLLKEREQEEVALSETSKKIFEALKSGKEDELADILYQRKMLAGVDKLDAADSIKLKIQYDNPDWTVDDVEDEYEQKYGIGVDKDDMDDNEYAKLERRAQRKIDADAKASKDFLVKLRDEIQLPDFKQAPTVDPEAENFINETTRLQKEFSDNLTNSLNSFKELDLSISDEDVQFAHKFNIQDSEKADLSNKAKDFWQYVQSRYSKDGKYDTQKLLTDIYFNENRSKVIKSAVTRAMNLAKVELVKGVANVQDTRVPSPSTNLAAEQAEADKRRFYLGE